tara:strand:- start:79 stop:744 length:666 start_codon:yes stop_codon:yes gene_type:complete
MNDLNKSKISKISISKNKHPLWAKKLVRIALWIAYSGYKTKGIENIPTEGPLIIASTHLSYLDPIILSAFISRNLFYYAKKELFRNYFFSKLITRFGAILIDRDGFTRRSFQIGNKILKSEECIVIFPEGGILEKRDQLIIKSGIGMISALSNTPILPVSIKGSDTLFNLRSLFSDSTRLSLNFGKIINPKQIEFQSKSEHRKKITKMVEDSIEKLENESV